MKNTLNNKNYINIYINILAKKPAKLNMTFIYKLIITFMWRVGVFFYIIFLYKFTQSLRIN